MSEPREPGGIGAGGRPPALDEEKRRTIIALLANGSSSRMAAGYVGCSPATLMRTMDRDPDFAAAVARAERSTEIEALRRIKAASQESRYWRAAAWLLERRNPQEFADRPPKALTEEQIARMFRLMADPFVVKMPDKDFFEAMERLESLMDEGAKGKEQKGGAKGDILLFLSGTAAWVKARFQTQSRRRGVLP